MLWFVTGNTYKFQEIEAVLAEYEIELKHHKMALQEIGSDDLKEIALHKAKQAFAKLTTPLIVDDTGLYFEAYKGFPGPNTKFIFNTLGYEGILKLLAGKNRKAYSHSIICFIEDVHRYKFFEGKLFGSITNKVIRPNTDTMPFNRIFKPEGEKRVIAQMGEKEKLAILPRTIAARKLAAWLKEKSLHELIENI
ncbi:MAG: non-canonical purine NTP pyrophosphatase [Candidatus Diapherotrites archaeon]|nr:non-canonical purine NTP pyrophosphatase [Candidatus Diapherotrites archaeon]